MCLKTLTPKTAPYTQDKNTKAITNKQTLQQRFEHKWNNARTCMQIQKHTPTCTGQTCTLIDWTCLLSHRLTKSIYRHPVEPEGNQLSIKQNTHTQTHKHTHTHTHSLSHTHKQSDCLRVPICLLCPSLFGVFVALSLSLSQSVCTKHTQLLLLLLLL